MSIHSLPPEITLKILFDLPIQSICSIEATSTSFRDLISTNRDAVYRAAALLHGFVEDDLFSGCNSTASHRDHLQDALKRPYISDWLRGVSDWKEFCKKHFTLEQAWQGAGPGLHPDRVQTKSMHESNMPTVSNFKVDEVERTVIATTPRGQLLVLSIDTQECLWSLPRRYFDPGESVSLEASGGFVVMFREDRNVLDIWRRSADCFNPSTYLPCSPSHQQIQASPEHVPSFPPNYPPLERSTGRPFPSVDPTDDHGEPGAREGVPRRGAYLPFTQLEYNESVHKVRVCYPYMAVSVHSANGSHFHQIDVWEIPPMARRRTVRLEPPAWEGGLRTLSDMEQYVVDLAVGDGHLYVCWNTCIALYAWGTAENPNELGHEVHVDPIWRFSILELHAGNVPCFLYQLPDDSGGNDDTSQLEQHIQVTAVVAEARDPNQVRESLFPMGPSDMLSDTFDEFRACPGPRGMDLAAITLDGWIVYLPNPLSTSSMPPRPPYFRLYPSVTGEPPGPPVTLLPTLAFDRRRILCIREGQMFCIPVVDRIHPARRPADSSESVSGPMAPALTKRFFHFTNFQGPRTRCGALEVFETGFCFARREEIGYLVSQRCLSYVDFADPEQIALPAPSGSTPTPDFDM